MNSPNKRKTPGNGFEPLLDDPESPVLPLDDPGINTSFDFSKSKELLLVYDFNTSLSSFCLG